MYNISMRKTFQYRLCPTKAQRTQLNETLEICRLIYNKVLETRKNAWEQEKKSVSKYDTHKMLPGWKVENPRFKSVHSQVLQNVSERVDLAFRSFFLRVKHNKKAGYPRFKGYGRYDSFTFPKVGFKIIDNRLRLSKIGDVKIKLHRPIDGEIKTLTIKRDRLGNWYASFSVVVTPEVLPLSDKVIGIDLGLTTFATLSDGGKIKRQRWMKRDELDLKRIQRKVSRLPKDSIDRRKSIRALNHIYQRITNRRKDFSHKESRKLVNEFQIIVFENLNIKGMAKDTFKTIKKGVADVAWDRFVQNTQAKAGEAGRTVVLVNPKNTTQMCSGCGRIVKKDLSVRVHDCPHCGLKLSRDLNAAINILARGLASFDRKVIEAQLL